MDRVIFANHRQKLLASQVRDWETNADSPAFRPYRAEIFRVTSLFCSGPVFDYSPGEGMKPISFPAVLRPR